MKIFNRIDKKLLFCFLSISVMLLGIAIFIAYNISVRTLREQTFENLTLAAETIKANIYTFITAQKNIARDFSSDMAIKGCLKGLKGPAIDWPKVIEGVKRHIMANKMPLYAPYILDTAVLDNRGIVVFSTNEAIIGNDDSVMDYFVMAGKNGYFGDLHYSTLFNEPIIEVSAPIIDNDTGDFLGVIVNRISGNILANITRLDWIERYIRDKDLAAIGGYLYGKSVKNEKNMQTILSGAREIGEVYIVNKDKEMITESWRVNNAMLNQKVDTESVQRAFTRGEDGIGIYRNYMGVPVIGASIYIKELQWVVIAEKDLSYIFKPIFRLKAQLITFAIFAFGIVAAVSLVLSKGLTAPIKRLIEATMRYSRGESDYRLKETSTDELGVLISSFNKMCDDIKHITISRDYFEGIIRNMNESLIITGPDYNIRLVNPITLKMLCYEPDELIGRPLFAIIEGLPQFRLEDIEDYSAPIKNIIQGVDLTYRAKDGGSIAVSFSSFAIFDCRHRLHRSDCKRRKGHGCAVCEYINIVNIAHDITRHKEAEDKLQEAKEAAEATARLRSEYLASMSHEVRAPLNAILGMSEVLQEQVYGPLNERQANALHCIREGGSHLLSLINDILDVSKIEAGRLSMEIGQVSVKAVCQASLLFIKQDAHKRRIKVLTDYDDAVDALQADELRLKQILVNLLTNACKFTREGGTIGLEVVGNAEKGLVNFIVWDNGVGISEEDMGHLFKPFMQLNKEKSGSPMGAGLGLFLVKQMTELHGGHISIESERDKGSRFIVSLPWRGQVAGDRSQGAGGKAQDVGATLAVDRQNTGDTDTEDRGQVAGCRRSYIIISDPDKELKDKSPLVLIADDDEVNIDVFSTYLGAKGFRVAIARNGREAIDTARTIVPNVILMDIQMPEMDGLEAARHIREDSALKNVPIIALTAVDAPFYRERCLKAGMNDFINKPVSLDELVNAIKTHLWKRDVSV